MKAALFFAIIIPFVLAANATPSAISVEAQRQADDAAPLVTRSISSKPSTGDPFEMTMTVRPYSISFLGAEKVAQREDEMFDYYWKRKQERVQATTVSLSFNRSDFSATKLALEKAIQWSQLAKDNRDKSFEKSIMESGTSSPDEWSFHWDGNVAKLGKDGCLIPMAQVQMMLDLLPQIPDADKELAPTSARDKVRNQLLQ
jgi:hypothetical protein